MESELSGDDVSEAAKSVRVTTETFTKDELEAKRDPDESPDSEREFEQEGIHIIEGKGVKEEDVGGERRTDCFQCVVCSKAYRRRDHLKTHVWRHVNAVVPTPVHQTRYSFIMLLI